MAYRPSTQASYTIGSGMIIQKNQPAAQIAATHNTFSQMAPYMSWIIFMLAGIDPGVCRLESEIVSHRPIAGYRCSGGPTSNSGPWIQAKLH